MESYPLKSITEAFQKETERYQLDKIGFIENPREEIFFFIGHYVIKAEAEKAVSPELFGQWRQTLFAAYYKKKGFSAFVKSHLHQTAFRRMVYKLMTYLLYLRRASEPVQTDTDKHLIDFYNTYPSCQLSVYNQTSPSPKLAQAIREQFAPLLNVTDTTEKISRLLKFMHTAFRYKPDEEYWGQERYFFPEESLFHPYMDCEDYAILFCFLNRILTDYPAVLVAYPGHVASAVRMRQDITKGYILHKNEKYTLCDPAYKGSLPGEVMPVTNNTRPRVIESLFPDN